MTDNDVIKALECCGKSDECDGANCPYYNVPYSDKKTCEGMVMYDALDLINRQKAEIERLEEEHNKNFEKWKILDERTKERYKELYQEAKAIVRAEAIKEFAERLKRQVITVPLCQYEEYGYKAVHYEIDDLVKEMTEE